MSTGKISNYRDSGYDVSALSIYDTSNNIVSTTNPSTDIYTTTQSVGVIMVNQGGNSFSIYCSASTMPNLGAVNAVDDWYIVYPGWGFTLYANTNYGGTTSRTYINTGFAPQLFSMTTTINGVTVTRNILTTGGANYGPNATSSIKVYFRGVEVTLFGIS